MAGVLLKENYLMFNIAWGLQLHNVGARTRGPGMRAILTTGRYPDSIQ